MPRRAPTMQHRTAAEVITDAAMTGQPETYGPIHDITIIRTRVGLIIETTAVIEYERRTVHFADQAAEALDRWYVKAKAAGILPPGILWTVHEPVDER